MFRVFEQWRADALILTGSDKAAFVRRFASDHVECSCRDETQCANCAEVAQRRCVFAHLDNAACGLCNKTLSVLFEYEAYKRIANALAALTDAMCDDVDGLVALTAIVEIDLSSVVHRWGRYTYTNFNGEFIGEGVAECERDDKKAKTAANKALTACKKLQERIAVHFGPGGEVERELGARFERGQLEQLLSRADTDDATARRAALTELRAKLDGDATPSAKKRKKQ